MKDYTKEKIALLDTVAKSQTLDILALQLQVPYIYMGSVILILAILAKLSPLPEIDLDQDGHVADLSIFKQIKNASKYPQLVLGAITLMLYVAAEVIAGDTIGTFGKQLGVYGENGDFYLKLTSFTMTAMLIGYIVGIAFIPKYLSQVNALKISGILGVILVISIVLLSPGIFIQLPFIPALPLVIVLVALFGLVNALCWPAIWPLALENLGGYTKIGGAILIMAIIGGAIFPLLYGLLAESINVSNGTTHALTTVKTGNQIAYVMLLPAYLMIFFFAHKGHKYRSWSGK
jgi:fucose permease